MATRHTGGGEVEEDSDSDRSEQGVDRIEKSSEKEKRSTKHKFLHSKAVQRMMTGKKLGADVTPVKELQPSPAHVQPPTGSGRRTSDTVRLELENKRLKREKEMVEKTMLEYETQLAEKDEEISRMRKVKTGPLPHVQPVTSGQMKLEMSLVARDAEITQLAFDKNLLEHELQELQTKYKCLVAEKDAATHQIESVTHQWRTAQKMIDSMEKKKRTEQRRTEDQQQKDRIKQLEDELRGMAAEKQASEEALRKQAQNNQKHYERLLHRAQTKEDENKQQLLDVQSQLEESTVKVIALEGAKHLLQIELDEKKKTRETKLRDKLQEEKAQSHTTQQHLRQELETLQREQEQKILAAKRDAVEQVTEKYREKKMKYKKRIEALQQEIQTKLTENMDIRKYETRLAEQQQQLITKQQQLMAARESANRSSRQVTELTEEKRRIVNSYETKLAEEKRNMEDYVAQLQQQKELQQQTEGPSVSSCMLYVNLLYMYYLYNHAGYVL